MTEDRKKHLYLLLSLLALSIIVSVSCGILSRGYRREKASRALIQAVKANDTERGLAALQDDADPNVRDLGDEAPSFRRYLATLWQQMRGVKPPDNSFGLTALTLAVQQNNTVLAEALLSVGARDAEKCDFFVVHEGSKEYLPVPLLVIAVYNKNFSLVQALIRHGSNVNAVDYNNETPLFYAEDAAMVEALIAYGANNAATDPSGFTALDKRFQYDMSPSDIAVVRALIDQGANDAKALPLAARFGEDTEVLKRLLGPGHKANVLDQDGSTLLMLAVAHWNDLQTRRAVSHAIDVHLRGQREKPFADTPPNVVLFLIREGANVNFRDRQGDTPLLLAAAGGPFTGLHEPRPTVITILLKHGAQIDMRDKNGRTPLMVAASHSRPVPVRLLLQHGAQVNMRTRKGETALSLARLSNIVGNDRRDRSKVIRLLTTAGATE